VIQGAVSTDGVPTITLSIAGKDWLAVIDTGFNGDLELPEGLRDALNARYVGWVISALAGGQMIEEDVYLVDFPFDNQMIQAEVTFVSGFQILIGTHLLREYRLQINFVSKTVELERVKPSWPKIIISTIFRGLSHLTKRCVAEFALLWFTSFCKSPLTPLSQRPLSEASRLRAFPKS